MIFRGGGGARRLFSRSGAAERPLVWLHIGHGKTGTTALQKYFEARTAADRAFHYPRIGRVPSGAHHALFPLENQPDAQAIAHTYLKRVKQSIFEEHRHHLTLMSSEHLCYFRPRQVQAVARLLEGCDVRILYFVRCQDELMESTFKWEQIASPGRFPDVESFLNATVRSFDFLERLAPWREIFGDRALTVRLYHAETCGKDIIGAVETVLGLEPMAEKRGPVLHRESLGATMTRVLMAYQELHSESEKRQIFLEHLRQIERSAGEKDRSQFLSREARQGIMKRYAASNEALANAFLTEKEAEILRRSVS